MSSSKPSLGPDIKSRVDAAMRCQSQPADVAKKVMAEMRTAMDRLLRVRRRWGEGREVCEAIAGDEWGVFCFLFFLVFF